MYDGVSLGHKLPYKITMGFNRSVRLLRPYCFILSIRFYFGNSDTGALMSSERGSPLQMKPISAFILESLLWDVIMAGGFIWRKNSIKRNRGARAVSRVLMYIYKTYIRGDGEAFDSGWVVVFFDPRSGRVIFDGH